MAKRVNINISLPIGSVQIYVDPRKQMQAEKLITRTPQIMQRGYDLGSRKFGNQLLRIVKRSLNTGVPPPGSGVSWPPHSVATLKKYGAHTLLNLTGQYVRSVTIVNRKIEPLLVYLLD